jgi:predicted dehydrogenase
MFDIGIYGLNTSLAMLEGDTPVAVSALYAYPRDDPRFAEVEGGIDWRMTMASGINVTGWSSYCHSPYVSRQHYFGATPRSRCSRRRLTTTTTSSSTAATSRAADRRGQPADAVRRADRRLLRSRPRQPAAPHARRDGPARHPPDRGDVPQRRCRGAVIPL